MKRKDKDTKMLWSEVVRLTLEVERLQQQYDEKTNFVILHRGSALACSDAVGTAYYEERQRAERLEKLLRLAEDHINAITPEWYNAGQKVLTKIRDELSKENKA